MLNKRLRVFQDDTGYRFVKQLAEEATQAYLTDNPTIKLVR